MKEPQQDRRASVVGLIILISFLMSVGISRGATCLTCCRDAAKLETIGRVASRY
jgi:hypothetical protein